jgi:hypothetical protein
MGITWRKWPLKAEGPADSTAANEGHKPVHQLAPSFRPGRPLTVAHHPIIMHHQSTIILAALLTASVAATAAPAKSDTGSLIFSDVEYLPRWSQGGQHEFTPKGQEDLRHWLDMVTINYYRTVTDGDGLAAMANSVLENYKSHRAIIVRTNSVPRSPTKPAEYFIVALFPQPDFIEAAFARFKIGGGVGLSVVYSRRIYGQKIGNEMSAFLQSNGPTLEKALMSMANIPPLDGSKH